MKYWITRHWPHPKVDDHPWSIYLKSDQHSSGNLVSVGDQVLFYETARAIVNGQRKSHAVRVTDGAVVELRKGGGLVRAGIVTGPMRLNQSRYDYGDEGTRNWRWEIPCSSGELDKTLPHETVRRVLGFRMFFKGGLREITSEKYNELLSLGAGERQ